MSNTKKKLSLILGLLACLAVLFLSRLELETSRTLKGQEPVKMSNALNYLITHDSPWTLNKVINTLLK